MSSENRFCGTVIEVGDDATALLVIDAAAEKCSGCDLAQACASAAGQRLKVAVPEEMRSAVRRGMRVEYSEAPRHHASIWLMTVVPALLLPLSALTSALLGASGVVCAAFAVSVPLIYYIVAGAVISRRSRHHLPIVTSISSKNNIP